MSFNIYFGTFYKPNIGIQKEKTESLPGPSLAEGIKSLIFQSFFAIMIATCLSQTICTGIQTDVL